MSSSQRIVILGDPHITPQEEALWREEIIPDLNALKPDRVLVLGDLSGGPGCGTQKGTLAAVAVLSEFSAPWASIIGNHDLQAEEFETDEAAVAMMLSALGRDRPGWVIEDEGLAFVGLENTFWRRNTINKNEIVFDEAQQAWLSAELTRLGDKPVVILGHTPPIGSGVMVMSELHARVGNAYANQNRNAGGIQQIIWNHPNILFWFSGHNHLGQHYRDALARRLGVLYAHTGTASRVSSRDGYRHSRVLEIDAHGGVRVRTFDHTLRTIDPALDFADPRPLSAWVGERHRLLGKRFVPCDPRTMEQPAPATRRTGARFLFLSDAHSTAPLVPIQKRVAGWCARRVRELMPDAVLLGGDITHRARPEQAQAFMEAYQVRELPHYYLPGNNEGPHFCYPEGVQPVAFCQKAEEAEGVYLLATSTGEQAAAAVEALLSELPQEGSVLVFAHFPPFLAGEENLHKLQNAPATIHWVCGHRHQARHESVGSLHVTICAGLDPVKVRCSRPEILAIDWDGSAPRFERHAVPKKVLNPPGRKPLNWAGLAFRGTAETLLGLALEREVPAIQFHYFHSSGAPTAAELGLARQYRERIPGGFLSLHLPNFPHPAEGVDLGDMEEHLRFAEGIGVDDLTAHLPNVTAGLLYDEERRFRDTEWAHGCLGTYEALSARALKMGAQISFENVYNKRISPPGEERLSTQPWQLLLFVEEMRRRLRAAGFSEAEVERVGIIFDAGHAFADAQFTKHYGLADWLTQVSPYLQLSHIHQVKQTPEGPTRNHQTISDLEGPLINFRGLLCAYRDASTRPFPLLVEVREQEAALESYATLHRAGLLRNRGNVAAED